MRRSIWLIAWFRALTRDGNGADGATATLRAEVESHAGCEGGHVAPILGSPPALRSILDAAMSWLADLEVRLGLGFSKSTHDHVDEVLPVWLVGPEVAADTLAEAST